MYFKYVLVYQLLYNTACRRSRLVGLHVSFDSNSRSNYRERSMSLGSAASNNVTCAK